MNSDPITATFASAGDGAAANVGNYAINATLSDGGSGALANYTYGTLANLATLTVNKAALTITANANSKTYGATATDSGSVIGIVNSDPITASFTSAGDVATANIGSYAINATLSDGGSGALANYTYGTLANLATLTVNKAALTVTANANTKTYGDTASESGTISGIVNSDPITAAFSSAGDAATSDVGNYAISATLSDGGSGMLANYSYGSLSNLATLAVNQAPLTITANNNSKTYGGTASDSGVVSGVVNGDGITATFSSTGDAATAGVSTYAITATVSDPNNKLANYAINETDGHLVVSPATISVTADNKSRVYGQANPTFTASYSGFVNSETPAVLSGSPSFSTTANTTSPVGVYTITLTQGSLAAANYQFTFANGTLVVNQATTSTSMTVPPTITYGVDSVTISASVTANSPGSGTPTGNVTFYDGANFLGTVALTNGSASLTLGSTALSTGGHTLSAAYSGDANFTGSAAITSVAVGGSSGTGSASISGLVFADLNNDGQVDFGEKAIANVTVNLDGTDDLGHAVHQTQTTDANGIYQFITLRAGTYSISEVQPAGYTQGINTVGTINNTPVGIVSGDVFSHITIGSNDVALNYNFAEQYASTGTVHQGQTATIGFWNNKNGQALINGLNGSSTSKQLGNWLSASFPNLYGSTAGSDSLAGKTNAQVAAYFQTLFVVHGTKTAAQILATALAVYTTNSTLDNTNVGSSYGFIISNTGLATSTWNVGSNGTAFGVANNTTMTIMQLLDSVNSQSSNGSIFSGNSSKLTAANNVFTAINEAGDI